MKKSFLPRKFFPVSGDNIRTELQRHLAQDAPKADAADDMELVRRVHCGDDAAMGAIVDSHGPRLYLLAVSLLGNREDAQDAVQETFIGAMGGLTGFQGRSTVKTWLTRILMNTVANLRRRQRVRKTLPLDDGEQPESRGDGLTHTGRSDARMDISAVMALLPEEQRVVVLLREIQGMTYDEMAAALNIPRGTVESRLFRARQKLKELLGDYLA
jgi:RNA polymerase sigma-70 factor (ECF subfamily)